MKYIRTLLFLIVCCSCPFVDYSHVIHKFQQPPKEILSSSIIKRDISQDGWINHVNSFQKLTGDTWLVELDSAVSTIDEYLESYLAHTQFQNNITVRFKFDSPLFYGVSLQFKYNSEHSVFNHVKDVAISPAVIKVWPVTRRQRSVPKLIKFFDEPYYNPSLNATVPPGVNVEFSFPAMSRDTGVFYAQEVLNLTGYGIKVAIVDTGIDYNHPWLGGCFGPGCKVAYGYDYVGDDYGSASNFLNPDNDPMDCAGHGTHVAGIVAGFGPEANFRGVSYNSTLGAYRIFGCNGATQDDVILAALQGAYFDRMDIINLSLGDDNGWSVNPANVAPEKLVKLGVVVVAAAGNQGEDGLFSLGSPAADPLVDAVASVDNTFYFGNLLTVGNEYLSFQKGQGSSVTNWDIEPKSSIISTSLYGKNLPENDACDLSSITGDISGKVVLIRRGQCTFDQKVVTVQSVGAVGVIIYNNIGGNIIQIPSLTLNVLIPVFAISQNDGEKLAELMYTTNGPLNVTFSSTTYILPNPNAKLISTFSSIGLTNDLGFKPDVAAPGGEIFSTYPLMYGGFATLSGTSMATPYISGSFALLLQAVPNLNFITPAIYRPLLGQAIIQNTATLLTNYISGTSEQYFDNPIRQGSGLINIAKAISSNQIVLPSKLQIKYMDDTFKSYKQVVLSIINSSPDPVSYSVMYQPSLYVQAESTLNPQFFQPDNSAFLLSFSSKFVTVGGSGQASISVKFSFDSVADSLYKTSQNWIIGGYIIFKPLKGNGTKLSIPFAFYKGNYEQSEMLDYSAYNNQMFPSMVNGTDRSIIGEGRNAQNVTWNVPFTLQGDDQPVIVYKLLFSSPRVFLAILDSSNSVIGISEEDYYVDRSTNPGDLRSVKFSRKYFIPSDFNLISLAIMSKISGKTNFGFSNLIDKKLPQLEIQYKNFPQLIGTWRNQTIFKDLPGGDYSLVLGMFHTSIWDYSGVEIWRSPMFSVI